MTAQTEIRSIFLLLKAHLKTKKVSYAQLATRLKMSESNVKRIFSTRSCSLQQIAEICSVTGTSFVELVSRAQKQLPLEFTLPAETEGFFMKNFEAFILWRHLFAAEDPQDVLKHSPIPNDRLRLFLKRLEEFRLIRRQNGKIEIIGSGYLNLSECPQLNEQLIDRWTPWFMEQVTQGRKKPSYFLRSVSTGLSRDHRAQMIEEVERLVRRYLAIGFEDQNIDAEDFESVGICIGIGPHRIGFFENDAHQVRSRRHG